MSTARRLSRRQREKSVQEVKEESDSDLDSYGSTDGGSGSSSSEYDDCKRQRKRQEARKLIRENKLKDAILLLEKLPDTQSKKLLLAECYLQVGRLHQAIECVEELRNMMTIEPRPRADDVMQLVDECLHKKSYIRAMNLLYCATRLYKMDSKPDEAIVGIRNCTSIMDDIIRNIMPKEKDSSRVIELGSKFQEEMAREIRGVTECKPGSKADMEARCLCDVGLSFRAAGKYLKSVDFFKQGIKVMKRQFGLNAPKLQVYGHLFNNLAIVYRIQGHYGKAMTSYTQAIESYSKAIDWESYAVKEKCVEGTKSNLSIVKLKMGTVI